jgi:hypothetical protein
MATKSENHPEPKPPSPPDQGSPPGQGLPSQENEPLTSSDWWRLEQEMSFSRDYSHLTWQDKIPMGGNSTAKKEVPKIVCRSKVFFVVITFD